MTSKNTIKAKEIVSDILSGMTNRELMNKYRVSLDKLQSIFSQLLDANAIEKSKLEPLLSVPHKRLDSGKRRQIHRNYAFVQLPIFDTENLLAQGTIVDITENGFQTLGIPANVGDTREFLIQADYYADVLPFVAQALCRWSSTTEEGECMAGFEMSHISAQGLLELRKLTSMLTLSE